MERFRGWHAAHRLDGLPYDDYMGLAIENERLRNPYHRAAIPAIRAWERVLGTEVIAPEIRENGPKIFVSTHPGFVSTLHLPYAVAEVTGRVPVMTPKRSLVYPTYRESEAVLEATGKTGGDIISGTAPSEHDTVAARAKGVVFQAARHGMARVITESLDTIPVDRSGGLEEMKRTMEEVNQVLRDGRILGTFLQWTRTDENSLQNAVPFAASIIKNNPDVPYHIVVQQLSGKGMTDPNSLAHPRIHVSAPYLLLGEDRRLPNKGIHALLLEQTARMMYEAGITEVIPPKSR